VRESHADRVFAELRDRLLRGEVPIGQRLVEEQLADEFQTSRTPVREALRRLEDEGLVETRRNALTRVAPVRPERIADAFPVVAALHGLATRLAVPALSTDDIDRMERHDAERTGALRRKDVLGAIAADDRLHGVLLQAAHNEEVARLLARVMPHIRRLDIIHFTALTERENLDDGHAEIIDACRRGDAWQAGRLVEDSFLRLGEHMASILGPPRE
jgi:DNA-binding GntR family transcriptional regulator